MSGEESDNIETVMDQNENGIVTSGDESETSASSKYAKIYKPKLSMIKKKAEQLDRIVSVLTAEKYKGTEKGDKVIGFAASLVPQCGYAGLATLLPLAIASVFMNANIPLDLNCLVDSQPSRHKIQSLISQNAVDTVLLTQESISDNSNVYISCDEGDKKGNKNLAKYMSITLTHYRLTKSTNVEKMTF